jgi:hypothetical protein
MPGIDPASGTFVIPIWAAGAIAALLVVVCIMALRRAGQIGNLNVVVRWAAVLIGALLVLVVLDRWAAREHAAERRALEARAAALTARAVAPGSALACLDAGAGDTVEASCQKAVFADAQTVAAAVSYVAARLRLLNDGLAYARSSDRAYEKTLNGLRRAIAADRFGIVAHVLKTRQGCMVERCAAFALVGDTRRIKLNLKKDTFAGLVERHALAWTTAHKNTSPSAAAPTPAEAAPTASVLPNLSFPSAASIPPVSIMNAEPPTETSAAAEEPPAPRTAAAPAAMPAKPPAPPRRPARRAQSNGTKTIGNASRPAPAAPLTLTPPPTALDTTAPTRAQ